MTPAEKWIAALRSGEFKQTRGCLVDDQGYCCLGVAAVVARDNGVEFGGPDFSEESDLDPYPEIREWLGLADGGGYGGRDPEAPLKSAHHLARDNDGDLSINLAPKSFAEIADIIESRPPGLFTEPH